MYEYTSQIATTTQVVQDIAADVTTTVIVTVGLVLAVAVLLVGIGFGWRKLQKYVTGKRF